MGGNLSCFKANKNTKKWDKNAPVDPDSVNLASSESLLRNNGTSRAPSTPQRRESANRAYDFYKTGTNPSYSKNQARDKYGAASNKREIKTIESPSTSQSNPLRERRENQLYSAEQSQLSRSDSASRAYNRYKQDYVANSPEKAHQAEKAAPIAVDEVSLSFPNKEERRDSADLAYNFYKQPVAPASGPTLETTSSYQSGHQYHTPERDYKPKFNLNYSTLQTPGKKRFEGNSPDLAYNRYKEATPSAAKSQPILSQPDYQTKSPGEITERKPARQTERRNSANLAYDIYKQDIPPTSANWVKPQETRKNMDGIPNRINEDGVTMSYYKDSSNKIIFPPDTAHLEGPRDKRKIIDLPPESADMYRPAATAGPSQPWSGGFPAAVCQTGNPNAELPPLDYSVSVINSLVFNW